MKVFFILKALLLGAYIASAQAKETTVRIHKVENVNGVEKSWDTSYTTHDPAQAVITGDDVQFRHVEGDGKSMRMAFFTDCSKGGKEGNVYRFTFNDSTDGSQMYKIIRTTGQLSEEELKAFREERISRVQREQEAGPERSIDNVIIMERPQGADNRVRKVIMVRAVKVSEPSGDEASKIGSSGPELSISALSCYPNPANGKFTLSFTLPGAEQAHLEIYSHDGRKVMEEDIAGIHGAFSREIDLTGSAKGVYMAKISHGSQSTVKKLVVE